MSKRYKIVGQRLLVKPDPVEKQTNSGIVLPGEWDERRERAATHTGVVIDISPIAWRDISGGDPWCKIGDHIVFARHAGKVLEDLENPKEAVMAIRDEDVQCIIEEVEDVNIDTES